MSLNLPEKPYRDDDDNVLKRRLLGAAVLIALAVIVLPLVLDGSGSESRFQRVEKLRQEPPRVLDSAAQVNIPDKSTIPRPQVGETVPESVADSATTLLSPPMPTPAAAVSPAPAPEPAPESTGSVIANATKSNPPVSDQVVESVAWIIQAGSYTDEANALGLRDELRTAGFPAFSSSAVSAGAAVYRVKVGPINNRQEAGTVQKQVETLIGQSTLIRQYP